MGFLNLFPRLCSSCPRGAQPLSQGFPSNFEDKSPGRERGCLRRLQGVKERVCVIVFYLSEVTKTKLFSGSRT